MRRLDEIVFSNDEMKAWELMKEAESVVITSHIHPDGDAIGSSLALAGYCRDHGKNVTVVIDDNIPWIYDYLEGVEEINKPSDVFAMSVDVLVVLDTNPTRIGRALDIDAKAVINIDHHGTNPRKCDHCIIREESSSTAELLYRLFICEGYGINVEIANCLYTGLITDTVFFKTPNITVETYIIAGDLIRAGANGSGIAEALERKEYKELMLTSKALSGVKLYFEGSVAGVSLDDSYDELELTDSIIDTIRYIDGIKIAFLLKHELSGGYRVRMRSKEVDVSEIAAANGGGGHKDAGGFTIYEENLATAETLLLGEIEKWLG